MSLNRCRQKKEHFPNSSCVPFSQFPFYLPRRWEVLSQFLLLYSFSFFQIVIQIKPGSIYIRWYTGFLYLNIMFLRIICILYSFWNIYLLLCVWVFVCICICMYMYVCVWLGPWRPEEDVRYPRTGVIDDYKLLYGCWELNQGPLQEQPLLLTFEPSF